MNLGKKASFYLIFAIIAGISGIFADRVLFPHLFSSKFFARSRFFQDLSDNVTVINKTEQVYVKEESSLGKIADQEESSVVNIAYQPIVTAAKASSKAGTTNIAPGHRTGMIVTSDGLIATYSDDKDPESLSYSVTLADGNSYPADFYGFDNYSNVLFLKVSAANLPVVSFGDSDSISSGEKAIALGNSLGNYGTMISSGVIKDFDPEFNLGAMALSSSEKLEGVFRTSISDQAGFVGGPVIDYSSQVIGMTGKITADGQDSFFQIPSNKLRKVIDKALAKKLDSEASLGIYYVPIDKAYASANGLGRDQGALVYSQSGQQGLAVIAGSAADKAGIRLGDLITKVSDSEISASNSLSDILYGFSKGDNVTLTIIRNGEEISVPVTF